jgi:hypothetical protein
MATDEKAIEQLRSLLVVERRTLDELRALAVAGCVLAGAVSPRLAPVAACSARCESVLTVALSLCSVAPPYAAPQ